MTDASRLGSFYHHLNQSQQARDMRAPMVGLAAPRMVHRCTIKNNSTGPVRVQILYRDPAPQGGGNHQAVSAVDVPAGGAFRAEERTTNHGSYQTRQEIAGVKVTRADGRKQKLTAPFDGVQGVELDWLFVVDNWQIHSVNRAATAGLF